MDAYFLTEQITEQLISYRTVQGLCPLALHRAQLADAKNVNGYNFFSSKQAGLGETYVEGVKQQS